MDELTDITILEENTPDNSYDENGNPIEYINQKYKWNTGRNLESITYWHKYTASYKNGKWKYYDTNLKRKYILW